MIISLAAATADFKQFEWMYNAKKQFKLNLDGTPVPVDPDDLIGFRKATRGPTAGAYQVVLAKYPQKIYRSIKQEQIDDFIHNMKEFKGVPELPEKTGQRRSHMRKDKLANDKLESQYYVAPSKPREYDSYDRADYQWRKVIRPVAIRTKANNNKRQELQPGDFVGMRYLRKSHGGYIILPSEERINITHDLYEQITNSTDICPYAQQQKGIVTYADLNARNVRPGRRITIPKKYKVPALEQGGSGDDSDTKLGRHQERIKPLTTQYDYKDLADDDEEFLLEDDEEDEILNPPVEDEEFELEPDTVNNNGITPIEDEDFDEEDDPEMDYHKDQEVDEEGEPVEDEEAELAHEGLVLKTKNGEEWVIVSIEEQGLTDVLVLYHEGTKALRHYKVPAGEDLRNMKSVTVGRTIEGDELDAIMEKAADLEMSAGKRL